MAKIIKQHKNTIFAGTALFAVLATVLVLSGAIALPVLAANPENITVTATIQEWLTFAVGSNSLDLGNLVSNTGVLAIGANTTTMTANTNSADGYSITLQGQQGGLYNAAHLIPTPAAATTTTCSISGDGTDAYGAQGVSTDMTVASPFNVTGNVVGSVASSSSQTFATSTYAGAAETASIVLKASANKYDAAGSYTDQITLTLVANP